MIPFASGEALQVATGLSGQPVVAGLLAFSANGNSIAVDAADNITLITNQQYAFSVPVNCTITSMAITVGTWASIEPSNGITVYPYVMLYRAAAGSNVFSPIAQSKTIPATGFSGAVDANTMLSAINDSIDVQLSAGDRLLICGLMETTGTGLLADTYPFYYTGGFALNELL